MMLSLLILAFTLINVNSLAKAILMLSKEGIFTTESLKKESGASEGIIMEFLEQLVNDGIVEKVNMNYRVKVSTPALIKYLMEKGYSIDLEDASRYIPWDAFEELISYILSEWEFRIFSRVRVPVSGSRYEFDVVAYRKPLVLLIEAKRHKYVSGKITQIIRRHIMKVDGVAREPEVLMSRIGCDWGEALLIPIVVTWHRVNNQLIDGVPVVSIYQFNSFIASLDSLLDSIKNIKVTWSRIK